MPHTGRAPSQVESTSLPPRQKPLSHALGVEVPVQAAPSSHCTFRLTIEHEPVPGVHWLNVQGLPVAWVIEQ